MKAWSRPATRRVGKLRKVLWAWEPEDRWIVNCSKWVSRPREVKHLRKELQRVVECASLFIWLRRDDPEWLEGEERKVN